MVREAMWRVRSVLSYNSLLKAAPSTTWKIGPHVRKYIQTPPRCLYNHLFVYPITRFVQETHPVPMHSRPLAFQITRFALQFRPLH